MEGAPSRSCASWNSDESREELRASERKVSGTNDQSHFCSERCMQIAWKGK